MEIRKSNPTTPVVVETPTGPMLIYRLSRNRIGVMNPPGTRVVRKSARKAVDFRKGKDSTSE